MSFQVINDVTRALGQLIESQIKLTIPTATVSLLPPGDTLPEDTGVNLYLYRVQESPFTRNDPWRGDREHPSTDRPPLGLQLHYLLTPLGKTSAATAQLGDAAHTLLGISMLTLHEYPILNDAHIFGFDADAVLSDDLRNSFEDVKVTLSSVSVEDVSKIWATIDKPYRLSVAYEVSVVELVPDRKAPVSGAVVLRTDLDVFTLGPPRLTSLAPSSGPVAHVVGGGVAAIELEISGSGLGRPGQQPTVLVGGVAAELAAAAAAPFTSVSVPLPTTLDAGPHVDVRVVTMGQTSEPLTFTVTPWLASTTPIRTALDTAGPTLVLTGRDLTPNPQVRYEGPSGTRSVAAAVVAGELRAPIPTDLANGLYDVRAELSGGSQLSNGRSLEVIPFLDAAPALSVAGGRHKIDVAGARLNGAQVALIVDGIAYELGANADAGALSFTFQRLLDTGDHNLAVDVDGSRSHVVPFTVA